MISKFTLCAYVAAALVPCTGHSKDVSPSTVRLHVQSCDFQFKDTFHGSISAPSNANKFESADYYATMRVGGTEQSLAFNFSCRSEFRDVNEVAIDYGGHLQPVTKKWIPAFPGASVDEVSRLKEVTKTFPLDSANGHGFYMIQDETVGEPNRRVRHFSYCLFHETKAICGDGQVKRLVDAKSDMLPYALKILRSVEFSDTSAEAGKSTNP